ncbi:MAG: FtsK/SpoIIIE domain-containing protein, partial [Actinomycetota bacterium]
MLAPLALGLIVALWWSPRFALFAILGPVMAVGSWLEQRRRHRRDLATHRAEEAESERRRLTADQARSAEIGARARRRHPPPVLAHRRAVRGDPELWHRAVEPEVTLAWVDDRPLVVPVGDRTIAVRGPRSVVRSAVRAMVIDLAVSSPPSTVRIEAITGGNPDPTWLEWLPHHHRHPSLEDTTTVRIHEPCAPPEAPPAPRGTQLVQLDVGEAAPPWVDATVEVDRCGRCVVDDRSSSAAPVSARVASVAEAEATRTARALARWSDPAAPGREGAAPAFTELVGSITAEHLRRHWTSGAADALEAVLGDRSGDPFAVDLVADGPHAVIGGTTGSGKSELLRTLVASLCVAHPPSDVCFVLVDYKGGSAVRPAPVQVGDDGGHVGE